MLHNSCPVPVLSSSSFFAILGFELRASCLQRSHCTSLATCPTLFALIIFEIGSHFLFSQPGQWSSWFQPPLTGMTDAPLCLAKQYSWACGKINFSDIKIRSWDNTSHSPSTPVALHLPYVLQVSAQMSPASLKYFLWLPPTSTFTITKSWWLPKHPPYCGLLESRTGSWFQSCSTQEMLNQDLNNKIGYCLIISEKVLWRGLS
jgi:hypothetical protein